MQNPGAAARRRGVLYYLLAIFFFALNDALGKWLVADYTVGQLLALRAVGAALVLGPLAWKLKVDLTDRRRLGVQVWRVLFMAGDTFCFYYATRTMPLADVMTFYMAAPIIVTALSALLLREEVEPLRWAAVALGFVGVIVALRPSPEILSTASPIAFVGACMYGFGQIATRALRGAHWVHLVSWQFLGAGLIGAATFPFAFAPPGPFDLALLFLLGIVAMLCFMFMTKALALAPASVVAPLIYTSILWATALGWLIWGDTLSPPVAIGNALIIASGFIVMRMERRQRAKAVINAA